MSRLTNQLTVTVAGLRGPGLTTGDVATLDEKVAAAASAEEGSEAAAALAGQYANAGTDTPIPGAPSGERGALFRAIQADLLANSDTDTDIPGFPAGHRGAKFYADKAESDGAAQVQLAAQQAALAQQARDDTAATMSSSLVALLASLGTAGADWSVAASAFEATAASPTALIGKPVKVVRQGYDAIAKQVIYTDTLYATTRVALPYPSSTSQVTPAYTGNTDALSDEIYSTDAVVPFAVNSANMVSPAPAAAWVMPFRTVVGNSAHWEIVAFHRDGRNRRQVACVRVRARDSANSANVTPWQTVATTTISTLCEDVNPVEVFQGDLDVSSLPDSILFHLEAEVFPWIGTAPSILSSAGVTDSRKFGNRHFTRDTARAANPPIVYVSPTGNDTTGVCSTSDATAAATPCLTVQGAITKAIATTAVTGGKVDGLRVRIAGTVQFGTHNSAIQRNQSSGAIVIERGTGTARSAAIVVQSASVGLNMGGSGFLNPLLTSAAVIFKDVSVQRAAAGQFTAGASGIATNVQLWNVAFDNGNISGLWNAGGALGTFRTYGTVWTNYNANFGYASGIIQPLFRGLTCPTAQPEGVVIVGSHVAGAGNSIATENGLIFYANKCTELPANVGVASIVSTSAGQTVTGVAIVQNLLERRDTSTARNLGLGPDNGNGNILGAVISHNVSTGYGANGRWNVFYDESLGTNRRTHRYNRFMGNIMSQLNTKSSVFVWGNQSNPTEAPFRTGNWPFAHGAGAWGNFAMYATQAPQTEAQFYPGLGSVIGTSATVKLDPLFVNYAGTGGSGGAATAGPGGGDYHLQSGSPAKGIVPVASLGFDYAGNPRGSGVQDAGMYA